MMWSTTVEIHGSVTYRQFGPWGWFHYGRYDTVKHREYFLRVGPARVGWTIRSW